ncbi:MAG: SGNH/GDSL hydrolase family protein [Armatimonadota bacterium]|nr:MAG: SGNH/GDSL hydrolase family protein [Armatimonadota bacterium]
MTALVCVVVLVLAAQMACAAPMVQPTDPPSMMVEVVEGDTVLRTLRVAPPRVVRVLGAQVVIGDDAPNQWAAGTRLPALVNPTGSVTVGAVVPGSVVVRSAPGGPEYRVDKDYLLDERWAAIGRVATGRIPRGATVYLDYAYCLSRLDTVQLAGGGVPSIRRGKPAVVCPRPAGAATGYRALSNIWVRPGITAVAADDIYPVGLTPTFPKPDRSGTAATRKLLAAGGKVTIVALGDSVTAGGEASKAELAFPQLFASTLRKRYPRANIDLVNAGVGGSNSDFGLERLNRDVLAHHPQLVVIEFVNDMGWPAEKIRANYRELIARIRAAGAEVVICTPHHIWPEWMGNFDVALAALRKVAAEEKVGLADASARWAALRAVGIPYETLLVNCINHPDDRGHRMFVDALMELF